MSNKKSQDNSVSGWVRSARKSKKLTQKDLALELKISKKSLENYESGRVDVPTATAIGIARICEFPPPFFDLPAGRQSQNNDSKESRAIKDESGEVATKYILLLEQNVKRLEHENERLRERLKPPKKSK